MGLFSWIGRVLFGGVPDIYHPKKRLIFRYWNGKKEISADPMVLYRRIMDKGASLSTDYKVSKSASKAASKSHESLLSQLREIFEIKSFEEGGLTEIETLQLVDCFMEFCESLKKNSNPFQTQQEETLPPSPPSSEENQPTPNSLDSGSIEEEAKIAEPTP